MFDPVFTLLDLSGGCIKPFLEVIKHPLIRHKLIFQGLYLRFKPPGPGLHGDPLLLYGQELLLFNQKGFSKPSKVMGVDLQLYLFKLRPVPLELFSLLCLPVEGVHLPLYLAYDVVNPLEVLLCGLHLCKGLLLPALVLGYPCGLLYEKTPVLGLGIKDKANLPLLDY